MGVLEATGRRREEVIVEATASAEKHIGGHLAEFGDQGSTTVAEVFCGSACESARRPSVLRVLPRLAHLPLLVHIVRPIQRTLTNRWSYAKDGEARECVHSVHCTRNRKQPCLASRKK